MGQHVLVPVDGSAESEAALEHVLDRMSPRKITLLHVVDPVSTFGYADDDYFDFEGYQEQAKRRHDRGREMLEGYQESVTEHGIVVETVLTRGRPAGRILETIESDDVDHVVMGSRGRSGIGRVLFGSVAEAVTRRAPVPVTIVR